MCFSANASFFTAAVTGFIGVATIVKAGSLREIPLAAIPLIFAAQQAVEGMLWLTLPIAPHGELAFLLTQSFLIISLALWPVYAPFAAHLIEPEPARRHIMAACLLIGVAVAGYYLTTTLTMPQTACINDGHIVYQTGSGAPLSVGSLYLLATGVALLISSHRAVALLGSIVFVGSVVSYFFYRDVFVSVWCFFAAAASVVLFLHFEHVRLARLANVKE